MMEYQSIITDLIYLLAIINPASKIFMVATMNPPCSEKRIFYLALRSNIAAGIILITMAAVGYIFLTYVFKIHMSSLQVAGGIVMFLIGLQMVNTSKDSVTILNYRRDDVAIVPLAAPLTAGPGSIAAVISLSAIDGHWKTCLVIILALTVNFCLMLASNRIGAILIRFKLMVPLGKLTGLLVTAIAAEMVLSGFFKWLQVVLRSSGFTL